MKKLFVILALLCFLVFPSVSFSITDTLVDGRMIILTGIDADWEITDTLSWATTGVRVLSITFWPGAAADTCIIESGSDDTGTAFFKGYASADDEPRTQNFFGTKLLPYLDYSAGTYSAGATVIIILDLK